jgi:hypothetical protein
MADDGDRVNDPYRHCEQHCNHDLARGVGVEDLLDADGPFPPGHLVVTLSSQRAVLFDDDQLPLDQEAV